MKPFFKVQTGLQINTKYWWLSGKKFKFIKFGCSKSKEEFSIWVFGLNFMDAKHKKHFDVFWSLIHKKKKNGVCNFHVRSKLLGPSFRNAKRSVTQVTVTIKICSSCKMLRFRVHLRWHCGSTKWKKNFYEIVIFSFFERKESLGYQLKKFK